MSKVLKQKIAVSYRISDPIRNFKLRIKISQQESALAELIENDEELRDSNYLEDETHVFSWQEKIFSRSEIDFYKDEKNCLTDCQKEYHRWIVDNNVEGSLLYSYTQDDCFKPRNDILTKKYQSYLSKKNQSALPPLKIKKQFPERNNKNVIDANPAETRIRSNRYLYTEYNTMYIVADLTPKSENSPTIGLLDSEILLCSIRFDRAHNLLTINPGLTSMEPYTICSSNGIKYSYWIEDPSEKPLASNSIDEEDNLIQNTKRFDFEQVEPINEIQLPSSNLLRLHLNLNIVSAHDFSFDRLFVTYKIDLPKRWIIDNIEKLSGRTQRSYTKNKSAYFGYPVNVCLDYNFNDASHENKNILECPRLLISVGSLDGWTRYRAEGYASLAIPSKPGSFEFNVLTWRPVGNFIDRLRRSFTGGSLEFEDSTYCGIPVDQLGPTLNKSNLKVASSGSLKINMHIIYQSQTYLENFNRRYRFDKSNTFAFIDDVETAFKEFQIARKRMIKIKSSNELSLIS